MIRFVSLAIIAFVSTAAIVSCVEAYHLGRDGWVLLIAFGVGVAAIIVGCLFACPKKKANVIEIPRDARQLALLKLADGGKMARFNRTDLDALRDFSGDGA